ncbi:hypothetical protein F5Y05DRAFT_173141 [Hypoxylon sp. FL0543]|nr:hypothetical protein F5Y05DRAFT_173141 [Hypoxylon sp. FL0543]
MHPISWPRNDLVTDMVYPMECLSQGINAQAVQALLIRSTAAGRRVETTKKSLVPSRLEQATSPTADGCKGRHFLPISSLLWLDIVGLESDGTCSGQSYTTDPDGSLCNYRHFGRSVSGYSERALRRDLPESAPTLYSLPRPLACSVAFLEADIVGNKVSRERCH